MFHPTSQTLLVSLAAGAVNAIAGGGTFLSFPALTAFGHLSEKLANITSTLGLWPGSASSVLAARSDFRRLPRAMLWSYAAISLVGGALGSLLLLHTSTAAFKLVIPWLLLFATIVFAASKPIARWAARRQSAGAPGARPPRAWTAAVALIQLAVAIYGGYFGAGMSVLMLAGLAFAGREDMHQMNAMKVLLQTLINGTACLIFALSHPAWHFVLPMALCSTISGFLAMSAARRIPQQHLRLLILLCGIALTIIYFAKNYALVLHPPG